MNVPKGNPKAYNELQDIKRLTAFNVMGHTSSRKVNQHIVRYDYDDGSILFINARASYGMAYDKAGDCICKTMLRINTTGYVAARN